MKNFIIIFLIIALAVFFFNRKNQKTHSYSHDHTQNGYVKCGEERWPVKTLSDDDTAHINYSTPQASTIAQQVQMERPSGQMEERQPSEITDYSIPCYLIGYKAENDQDIHLVIEDIQSGQTMVAEVVNPDCESVQQSSRYNELRDMHDWFINNVGTPDHHYYMLPQPLKITLTGIGFWDFHHGQTGMAANGREIHPVLSMEKQ